jgi:hypothetical protein
LRSVQNSRLHDKPPLTAFDLDGLVYNPGNCYKFSLGFAGGRVIRRRFI